MLHMEKKHKEMMGSKTQTQLVSKMLEDSKSSMMAMPEHPRKEN